MIEIQIKKLVLGIESPGSIVEFPNNNDGMNRKLNIIGIAIGEGAAINVGNLITSSLRVGTATEYNVRIVGIMVINDAYVKCTRADRGRAMKIWPKGDLPEN